jgi:tyrosine-protein kinase Etk/Wzc
MTNHQSPVTGSGDQSPITNHQSPDDEEISLLDLLIVLAKHKKLILGLPFGAAVVAAGISLLMPNIYTGTTKILPPQQNQSAAIAMLGQLGTQLGGLAGSALGVRNPNELYVGMLKSRTVADDLIGRFELRKLYETKTLDDTRKSLENNTKITSGRDGIIVIEFDDKEPKRAATIANAYVEELYKLTQTLAVTEASQRRLFFERQLDQNRKNLASAEAAARQGLEKGGLVVIDAQGRGMVETTARLRGQIAVKEIQISAMRAFATGQNPDLKQAQHELDAMKQELAKMEGTSSGRDNAGSAGKADGMENLRLLRDVKYFETIFELLAKQYEIAKIDEARDASIVQVLDPAVEPERKSKPMRSLIVVLTALVAGFLAVIWVFIKEAGERARQNPEQAERLNLLRRHLRGK